MASKTVQSADALLANIVNLGGQYATPFAQSVLQKYGPNPNANNQLVEERIHDNALNGSGATSDAAARTAPTSIDEFINGKPAKTDQVSGSGISQNTMLLIGAGVIALVILKGKK